MPWPFNTLRQTRGHHHHSHRHNMLSSSGFNGLLHGHQCVQACERAIDSFESDDTPCSHDARADTADTEYLLLHDLYPRATLPPACKASRTEARPSSLTSDIWRLTGENGMRLWFFVGHVHSSTQHEDICSSPACELSLFHPSSGLSSFPFDR